jgi:hypothetical protein
MEARPLGAGSVDRFISSTSSWSSGGRGEYGRGEMCKFDFGFFLERGSEIRFLSGVWCIPCWTIYMVNGGSGPRGIGGGGGRRGSVSEVSGGVRTWSNNGIPRARKAQHLGLC